MNGGHDLGGMHGLGPIDAEPESQEPVFHAEWERRVFALTLAAGFLGKWNIDISRHARERQHPADYIRHTYYENWLHGLTTVLEECGLLSPEEFASGRARDHAVGLRVLAVSRVQETLEKGGPATRPVDHEPAFEPGDRVRVHNNNPLGHTRAPRYTRGRIGTVHIHHGAHVFPDLSAHGADEGQHVYSVRFTARELWGEQASPRDSVYVDLWDGHLEPV